MQPLRNIQQPQNAKPVCSVCVANYNGIDIIGDCVDAILKQDVDFEYEILIHDDASTDDSVTYISRHYPNVKLIASRNNVGFCISNNRMAAAARGQYILLINNDAMLFPDALRTLYDYATTRSVPSILSLPQYDAQSGHLIDIGSLSDFFLNPIPNLNPTRGAVAMVSGACLWIPTSIWHELGGFPDWFNTLAEDMYLCCVARLRGYAVEAIPHSGFRHWVGKSIGGGAIKQNHLSTNIRRRTLSERNKSYVMILCYPTILLLFLLPLHIILLCLEGIFLATLKQNISVFRDIYWNCIKTLWKERGDLFHKHRTEQALRKISLFQFCSPFALLPQKFRLLIKHGVPKIQ